MELLRDLFWHCGGYFDAILFLREVMILFPEIMDCGSLSEICAIPRALPMVCGKRKK